VLRLFFPYLGVKGGRRLEWLLETAMIVRVGP
jgi:hypothetical protein